MNHLDKFDSFNESASASRQEKYLIENFFNKVKNFFKGNSDPDDAFEEYDIEIEKVNNYEFKYYHNNRLVARIFQPKGSEGVKDGRPVFKLVIYLYESEGEVSLGAEQRQRIEKYKKLRNAKKMQPAIMYDLDRTINREISEQDEVPYYKLVKSANNTKWLAQAFYEFWAANTESGRQRTQELNIPKQSATPFKHFSPSSRKGTYNPLKSWLLPFGQPVSRYKYK